jgi:hypothetical protein
MKKIFLCFLNIFFYSNSESTNLVNYDNEKNMTFFLNYGNWCGPGHGGYQDCCNQTKCPKCNLQDNKVTNECLDECKPIDTLDYYCAIHDECCLNNEKKITCFPEGNKCYCDCLLTSGIEYSVNCNSIECSNYRSRLLPLFNYGLSCWYKNQHNNSVCNVVSMREYQINAFCKDGKEIEQI